MEKKRTKSVKVGAVLKGSVDKETGKQNPDYINLNTKNDKAREALLHVINNAGEKGVYLDLKSKKQQLDDYHAGVAAGRLKGDYLADMQKRIEDIPDFVRFEIYARVEQK